MKSVLFVCTANRCRSPMAEALLKAKVTQLGQAADWQIASAGTWTEAGLSALPLARQTMLKRGLNIDAHRSRPVAEALLQGYSVILVMTDSHREGLSMEFPKQASKIRLFSQLTGPAFDIDDPAAGTEEDYVTCATELADILDKGFDTLSQLAEVKAA